MKQNLEEKLRAASDKARALGRTALKHPVSSILSLCVLTICAATLVTFSQDEKPAPATVEPVAMALPADNVELIDTNGRKITVTVLSSDADGITIRLADRKEHQLPWNKLSTETIALITGKSPHQQALEQIEHLSPKELQKAYLAKDPLVMTAAAFAKLAWEKDEQELAQTDPGRVGFHTRPSDEYIRALEIKDPSVEEKVSLREEFEKLGVKPLIQVGESCSFFSIIHMVNHASLKKSGEFLPFNPLHKAALERASSKTGNFIIHHHYALQAINDIYGRRAHVMNLDTGIPKLTEEVLKQEIRNGKPCRAIIRYKGLDFHRNIVVIGFHTKDGETRYEYIDSAPGNTENRSGYAFMPNEYLDGTIYWQAPHAYNMLSIRFE